MGGRAAAKIGGLAFLLPVLFFVAAATPAPPEILVSRQLLAKEHLAVGDEVLLSAQPLGENPRQFKIAGIFEPSPTRTGSAAPRAKCACTCPTCST